MTIDLRTFTPPRPLHQSIIAVAGWRMAIGYGLRLSVPTRPIANDCSTPLPQPSQPRARVRQRFAVWPWGGSGCLHPDCDHRQRSGTTERETSVSVRQPTHTAHETHHKGKKLRRGVVRIGGTCAGVDL